MGKFQRKSTIDLSSLEDREYIVNDGKFSKNSNQSINKSNGTSTTNTYKTEKIIKKKSSKVNNNNHQYSNTNADEYVKSRREEIKKVDIKISNNWITKVIQTMSMRI